MLPRVVLADLDADADEGARQRLVGGLGLLGGHERGVALVADGLGQAADRAVRELLVVERLRDRRSCPGSSATPRRRASCPRAGLAAGPALTAGVVGAAEDPGALREDAAREHDDGEDRGQHQDERARDPAAADSRRTA